MSNLVLRHLVKHLNIDGLHRPESHQALGTPWTAIDQDLELRVVYPSQMEEDISDHNAYNRQTRSEVRCNRIYVCRDHFNAGDALLRTRLDVAFTSNDSTSADILIDVEANEAALEISNLFYKSVFARAHPHVSPSSLPFGF